MQTGLPTQQATARDSDFIALQLPRRLKFGLSTLVDQRGGAAEGGLQGTQEIDRKCAALHVR